MRTYRDDLLERLKVGIHEASECFEVVQNSVAQAPEADGHIESQLAGIVNSVSSAAWEMQLLIVKYGGFRDH